MPNSENKLKPDRADDIPNDTICPNCHHIYVGQKNLFGKLCIFCGEEIIPPEPYELPIQADNKKKRDQLIEKVRKMLRQE